MEPPKTPVTQTHEQQPEPTQIPAWGSPAETPRKPSKWRYLFIALGILQIFGIAIFIATVTSAYNLAKHGVSGTEFLVLILLTTVVPAVGLIAIINIIGLPIFVIKNKVRGIGLVLCIISFAISIIPAIYGGYTMYQLRVEAPKQRKAENDKLNNDIAQREHAFKVDNSKPEISEAEAIKLLNSCQLKGFYYTNQTTRDDGGWGELSSTGVVLTKVNGQPYRISIATRLESTLIPIARKAQKKCGGPQFWHDGAYEQQQPDGSWR